MISVKWVIIILLPIYIFLNMNWLQAQVFQFNFTQAYNYGTCNRTTLNNWKVINFSIVKSTPKIQKKKIQRYCLLLYFHALCLSSSRPLVKYASKEIKLRSSPRCYQDLFMMGLRIILHSFPFPSFFKTLCLKPFESFCPIKGKWKINLFHCTRDIILPT